MSSVLESGTSDDLLPVCAAAPAVVTTAAAETASDVQDVPANTVGNICMECEDDFEVVKHALQRKSMEFGGIVFSGCVKQVVILPEGSVAKDLLQH